MARLAGGLRGTQESQLGMLRVDEPGAGEQQLVEAHRIERELGRETDEDDSKVRWD